MDWADVVVELTGGAPAVSPGVLDLELTRIATAADVPVITFGIAALRDLTGAKTLGDLVQDPDIETFLQAAMPVGERRTFLRTLPNVVRRLAQDGVRPALALVEPSQDGVRPAPALVEPARSPQAFDPDRVPRGGEDLDAWARYFGLTEHLERLARVPMGPRGMAQIPLRQCVDLVRYPDVAEAWGVAREELRRGAEAELRSHAKRNASLLAQRAVFAARRRQPEDPWVGECVRVLKEQANLRAAATKGSLPIAFAYPAASVEFRPAPLRLVIRGHGHPHENTIDLATGALTNMGSHWLGSAGRMREDRAILECAIDALSDPEGKAVHDAVAWRAVPAWKHMLGAFEEAVAAERSKAELDEEEERVAFRLPVAAAGLPSVLLQRARKAGSGFTIGRQSDVLEALSLPNLTPLERETLETIALLGHASLHDDGEHARTRLRLLELLADHPRVHLEGGSKNAVRLRRARPTLRVVPVGASFRVDVGLGSAVLAPAEALGRSRTTHILAAADAAGETVYFADVDEVSIALMSALSSHAESLPGEGLDALLAVLSSFSDLGVDLDLPEDARGEPVSADARIVVQLSFAPGGALALALRIRSLPRGPCTLPGAPPRHVYGTSAAGARVFAARDLDDEEARAEHLLAELPLAGAVRRGPFDMRFDDPDRACDVLATLAELGDAIVTEWPDGQRMRVATTIGPRSLRLHIERHRDWFGVGGGVEVEGVSIGIHALLEAVRAGRRFVSLGNGALVALGRDLRARLERADNVLQSSRGEVAAHLPAVAAVGELVENESEQISGDAAWFELRARLLRAQTIEPTLPEGLTAQLRHYQEDGYRWLMRLAECGAGACLADDMGLGKTLQSLAVLEARRAQGPALVVAPTSVCANWPAESARFAPALDMVVYRGADRSQRLSSLGPGTVLVTSYDVMLRDIDLLAPIEFATVIFDEAHALKNGNSKRASAARRIQGAFRVALSGTPIENHTGELWSLFRIVVPGLFGSWERFRDRFAAPIERERDLGRRAALAATIRPYLLRRTKRDVSPELPPRTDVVRFVDLSAAERDLYEVERLRALDAAKNGSTGDDGRFIVLAALTRLRQLACHPRLRHPESTAASSKLESVLALIEELREAGHRALVFSQFTSHLALVAEALTVAGVTYLQLEGSTPAEARAERVRRFQASEVDVFLISLKAGGVGLNLTAADYVIHLDPWWNPAVEDQASDRAHRIGQDRPVTVVRLIARHTIEEAVLALHTEKRELAEAVLSGGDVAGRLSMRQLISLMDKPTADVEVAVMEAQDD